MVNSRAGSSPVLGTFCGKLFLNQKDGIRMVSRHAQVVELVDTLL